MRDTPDSRSFTRPPASERAAGQRVHQQGDMTKATAPANGATRGPAAASSSWWPWDETPRAGEVPLSFAQQRLWFLDQLVPGHPFYNVPVSYRLRGPLHAPALERALGEVVARHEALRTVFPHEGARP